MAVLILVERKEQCRLFHAVTLLELINTSAAVNEFLAAGVEGVALGADFNLELALYGTALEGFTACATDDAFAVGRMDVLFHNFLLKYLWNWFPQQTLGDVTASPMLNHYTPEYALLASFFCR